MWEIFSRMLTFNSRRVLGEINARLQIDWNGVKSGDPNNKPCYAGKRNDKHHTTAYSVYGQLGGGGASPTSFNCKTIFLSVRIIPILYKYIKDFRLMPEFYCVFKRGSYVSPHCKIVKFFNTNKESSIHNIGLIY